MLHSMCIFILSQNIVRFPRKPLQTTVRGDDASIARDAIPKWNFRGGKSDAFQLLTSPHSITSSEAWNVKNPPYKTVWQDKVYNSVHLYSLWRLCLLLLGYVIVPAWVKATGFSLLLPLRGGDAERRVHLIIGLSASVFMLDFRFCPAHTLETAGVSVCVSVCAGEVSGSLKNDQTAEEHFQPIYPIAEKLKEEKEKGRINVMPIHQSHPLPFNPWFGEVLKKKNPLSKKKKKKPQEEQQLESLFQTDIQSMYKS